MTRSEESSPAPAIGDEVDRFIKQIDSLATTLRAVMAAMQLVEERVSKDAEKFEEEHCRREERDGDTVVLVPVEHLHQYNKLRKRVDRYALADTIVPRSFLVSLISLYDGFLGRLLRVCFLSRPELLTASERSLTFAQIATFASLDEAKNYVLEKEVEAVLRESHAEQFDWLEGKFKMELRKGLDSWSTFIEVTERRNLFVHTDGVVSTQYLTVCGRHGVKLDGDLVPGRELHVSPSYFDSAFECIFSIGVKLAHVLWRKLFPTDRHAADQNLARICFDLLVDGEFALAKDLLDFASGLRKFSSDEYRRIFVVNRVQAYKWAGDTDKARTLLDAEDWSATNDSFRLAAAVLGDHFASAIEIMRAIGANGSVTKTDYREWPLFREIRKAPEFAATFEELFGEPLQRPETVEKPLERLHAREAPAVDVADDAPASA
jgi:hypothetical protein